MRNAAAGRPEAQARLRTDVLNWPAWEEAIFFACERVSRANNAGVAAAARAILRCELLLLVPGDSSTYDPRCAYN
jgi:hypothetical protein